MNAAAAAEDARSGGKKLTERASETHAEFFPPSSRLDVLSLFFRLSPKSSRGGEKFADAVVYSGCINF